MKNQFKKAVKLSFSKVKDHIMQLEQHIHQNSKNMVDLASEIKILQETLKNALKQLSEAKKYPQELSSTGNEGVHSNMHSLFTHSRTHSNIQTNSHFSPNSEVEKLFQTLTNKEFLIFLAIFQSNCTTYDEIASKLSLTPGCVRSYVSSLLKKGTPLIKTKLRNRKIILYVDKEFKTLTSEQKLVNLYYHSLDPNQATLI